MDTIVSFTFTINSYVNVIFSTNGLEVLSLLRAHADLKSSCNNCLLIEFILTFKNNLIHLLSFEN